MFLVRIKLWASFHHVINMTSSGLRKMLTSHIINMLSVKGFGIFCDVIHYYVADGITTVAIADGVANFL